jgi:broad specificity phosphatase PhoE
VSHQSVNSFLEELQENCLLLARHGETDWNAQGLIQGQQDRPLSAVGYRQRKVLFFRLRSVALARIFTSGLERAIQTALPLNAELGLSQEVLPALNEARLGVFEGESKTEFADELSARLYAEFLEDEVNVVLPGGGENLWQLDARIQEPLKLILESLHKGHVLVVSHRNVAKMMIRNLLGLSFEQAQHVEQKNHWLYIFAPRGRKIFLVKLNDATEPLVIRPGYELATVAPPDAAPSRVERGS